MRLGARGGFLLAFDQAKFILVGQLSDCKRLLIDLCHGGSLEMEALFYQREENINISFSNLLLVGLFDIYISYKLSSYVSKLIE